MKMKTTHLVRFSIKTGAVVSVYVEAVVVLEDEKVDMGFISRFFGRDPATVKLNRHLIGSVSSSSSSLTWKFLLSFFASRGFPTSSTDNDLIIVHGQLCNSRTKNPGREKVVALVVRLKDVDKLTSPSAVLVSQDEMENFFNSVLNDHHFAKKVAGVLVESGTEVPTAERGFSPVEKFPQVKFAPYKNVDYI